MRFQRYQLVQENRTESSTYPELGSLLLVPQSLSMAFALHGKQVTSSWLHKHGASLQLLHLMAILCLHTHEGIHLTSQMHYALKSFQQPQLIYHELHLTMGG